jgi:hypothetical protein
MLRGISTTCGMALLLNAGASMRVEVVSRQWPKQWGLLREPLALAQQSVGATNSLFGAGLPAAPPCPFAPVKFPVCNK